ncbi:MAG: PAS-domain containing protein [Sphingomonadaceae bacterium]|nr:PAS-domain containing protein [Sphingomonadaceae bacterium]
MIAIGAKTAVVLALLLLAWLAAAVAATVFGLKRLRAAAADQREARRLQALLGASPALPVTVAANGRLRGDPRIAERLALGALPQSIDELVLGVDDEDGAALVRAVESAQRTGDRITVPLRVRSSHLVLTAIGGPAPDEPGAALFWLFDMSESQREIARLGGEVGALGGTLDALTALIEAAPIPMWHRGPDLRLSLVNGAYVRAVEGESAADVIARGLELVEGQGAGSPIASAAAARDEGEMSIRTVPATVGGERRMLRVVDVPLGPSGIAGYALDIEELEEARADLSRFASAQREMLDRLSAGVAQFGADRGLVFWNRPFLRLFAIKPEWLGDRPEFERVLDRMRETGRVPESRDFPAWRAERRGWFQATDAIEENWMLPGGMHLRVVAQPLPDGGLLVIFEDRTEQVQLESARDTLLRVRTATFNNLFEAIGVFAADGRLHLWNNRFAEVWGISEEELTQHPRVDQLVSAVAKRLTNPARANLIRELVRLATVERQQRSGRVALTNGRHYEFAAVPLPDGNALFTMLDITDSRRIEAALRERTEALEEGDRVKTAFMANMSYELRTPLTSIGGFAEMLEAGYAGALSDTGRDYVGAILQSVGRLGGLIDDVLDLTQSEAGALPLAAEQVDLARLTRDAADDVQDRANDAGIDLVQSIDASIGSVTGDPRRLRQALDHVLGNAVDHTPAGGRVLVHAEGDAEAARITVSDDGQGISAREQARVFDRFHSVALGTRPRDGALGLGLPLTRQFVEAHGGRVTLQSEPGQGTTVTITLPRKGV